MRLFEREFFYEGCVVRDFAFTVSQLLDIKLNYEAIEQAKRNESLSTQANGSMAELEQK